MARTSIDFHNVSFSYGTMSEPLFQAISTNFQKGWTGVVGPNGSGKTTILKLSSSILQPSTGIIHLPGNAIYCRQRTDSAPSKLPVFIQAMDKTAHELRGILGIGSEWSERWETLSHGERKRAQIAVALWQDPYILSIDEPTNHLDMDAQNMLSNALVSFRGIGLLVSHDRNLLDTLCHKCLFIDPPQVILRPGGVSQGLNQIKMEEETTRKQHKQAKQAIRKLEQRTVQFRNEASRADRKRSKKGLGKRDRDARFKKDMARLTGKDALAGKRLNQLRGRVKQAKDRFESITVRKQYKIGIWQEGARSKRNELFEIEEGCLSLGMNRQLHFPNLVMKPDDRVALTGPNGSGKSTLIRRIVQTLSFPEERITYLPQEINRKQSVEIIDRVRHLSREKLGLMMTVVNRLGTRPPRLLETEEPSPGEIRKILLAVGVAHVPYLIIMDEPTNHLDLLSIECLEDALSDCPSGLLLVSHDRRFLNRLTNINWQISQDTSDQNQYRLEIIL